MDVTRQELLHSFELFRTRNYFVDHLTRDLEPVDLLTPNSYFWTVLDLAFQWEWEKNALALAESELAGMSGVRTLARSQWETVLGPAISALARGDRPLPSVGKANYHRGVEWNWLSQLFVSGELRHAAPERAFTRYLARQILSTTGVAGIGGISEVFDHRGPAGPDFQTWSMTGLVEALHRFAGVTIDVPNRTIGLRPQKPRRWPYIKTRKWFGHNPIDIEYATRDGEYRLTVAFGAELASEVSLCIEICLAAGRTPRTVRLQNEDRMVKLRNYEIREEPHRLIVEARAEQWQQLIVR